MIKLNDVFTVTLVSITEELKRNMNETICHDDQVKRCLHCDAGQHNGGNEKKHELDHMSR